MKDTQKSTREEWRAFVDGSQTRGADMHTDTVADWWLSKFSSLLQTIESEIEGELEIQRKVQEKSKEIVVIGRARVAGMVAEKYTRIGKIDGLDSAKAIVISKYKEI